MDKRNSSAFPFGFQLWSPLLQNTVSLLALEFNDFWGIVSTVNLLRGEQRIYNFTSVEALVIVTKVQTYMYIQSSPGVTKLQQIGLPIERHKMVMIRNK